MPVKVKICGITNSPDAMCAVEAGADALGFVFWPSSPRYVAIRAAAGICKDLPAHVLRTGVFVNASKELVQEAIAECGLNLLQFHGEETPEFCVQFGVMSMKAFRIRDAGSLDQLARYSTDAWLLDAWVAGKPGGTGETFNWDLAFEAQQKGRPVFLAGGLTSQNVGQAIRKARPFGVDVSGGVEERPGKKDAAKVKAFVEAARRDA
jgi:phosphoribosylanthranilate isomerase